MLCDANKPERTIELVLLLSLIMMKCVFFVLISVSAACLFRYNALSFVYLIYLLLIPLFPEPTSTTMEGKVISASALHAWWPCRLHPQNLDFFPNIAVWDSLIRTRPSPEDRGMRLELAVQFMKKKKPQIQPNLRYRDVIIIINTLGFGKLNPRVLNLQNKHWISA